MTEEEKFLDFATVREMLYDAQESWLAEIRTEVGFATR